jgi:hypothetical protein
MEANKFPKTPLNKKIPIIPIIRIKKESEYIMYSLPNIERISLANK